MLADAEARGRQEPPPELKKIDRGAGKGQYLLPVTNTERSVDLDLINNIMRLPYRERFSLILNELGTGLAGRGKEINAVVRRADPALKQIDRVLKILASQNRVLANLARNSDTALAPLARERKHVGSFIQHSSRVAEATAERRDDLAADIERLPRFLDELTPTMRRIGGLSDEATPVFADLGAQAPNINRMIQNLGPFSEAGLPAVKSLGDASVIGTPRCATCCRSARTCGASPRARSRWARRRPPSSSRSSAARGSSACSTTPSTRWPPSTATTRSGTTCGRA